MKLSELSPVEFNQGKELIGLAFKCPCCKREWVCIFFQPTSYRKQCTLMEDVVPDLRDACWVPYPAFESHAYEGPLERITIRPSVDISMIGHKKWFISNGEVEEA